MSEHKVYPTIADAKELANRFRRRGVIILSFDSGSYHAASYGHTRADCDAMAHVVDQIGYCLDEGFVDIPDGFGQSGAKEIGAIVPLAIIDALEEGLRLAEIAIRQGLNFDKQTTEEILKTHLSLVQIRKAIALAKGIA